MLVIMVGLPQSGKSTFIDMVAAKCCHEMDIIRPSDWYPSDIDDIDQNSRTDYQLVAWEYALDKISAVLASSIDKRLIVLDTCGATPGSLRTVFGVAKIHKHTIAAIFIATPRGVCDSRIDPLVVDKYISKIHDAVLEYNKMCNKLIIVKYDDISKWNTKAVEVAEQLCQI